MWQWGGGWYSSRKWFKLHGDTNLNPWLSAVKMLQRSTMTSRMCVLIRKCVFVFGFSLHCLSCSSCLNSSAWPFQPKYNLKLYLISRQASNLLFWRHRTGRLHLEEVLCELNGRALHSVKPALTYLGSFLEQGDHHRCVSAAHCPVEGTHPAVVDVLYHGPVVNQELDLKRERNAERIAGKLLKEWLTSLPQVQHFRPKWLFLGMHDMDLFSADTNK